MARAQAIQKPEYKRKRLNADYVRLNQDQGFIGKLVGRTTRELIDHESGELREVQVLLFEDERGVPYRMFEDGGLKNALAGIAEGTMLEIVRRGQKELKDGKRCNTYEVYELSAEEVMQ